MSKPANAPIADDILVSRPYGAEDDALDAPGGAPVTGTGYIVGFAFEANAGQALQVYDESGGTNLVFAAIFGVASPSYIALPPEQWIPYKAGARIVVGAGGSAYIRYRPGPIETGPVNP